MSAPHPVHRPGSGAEPRTLTGRIGSGPSALLREEILDPQFRYEVANLLPWYVRAEKALLAEYLRLGVLSADQAQRIAAALDTASPDGLAADSDANMSDLAFALEAYVLDRIGDPVPAWHADRSRNDLQATAQLLHARARMRKAADQMLDCFHAAKRLAESHLTDPMPGYTHLQPAQVMTPGFYLAGLTGQLLHTVRRWLAVYDGADLCPLGAGAMTGQELDWNRERLAALLGFRAAHPHALTAVASRSWALEAAAESSTLGVVVSRFVTDLMAWSSRAYRFIDLPDELSGISSAMPQKKNFPVLERIRGRAAHLTAAYVDVAMTQRGTAFANSVEVSKEGSAGLPRLFDDLGSMLRLLAAVLDNVMFLQDRMARSCAEEYLGGFSLGNALTLEHAVPWRTAQVIAGQYVVAATARGLAPDQPDPVLLCELATRRGHDVPINDARRLLERCLDPRFGIAGKRSTGSTHPDAVAELLCLQGTEGEALSAEWRSRQDLEEQGAREIVRLLAVPSGPSQASQSCKEVRSV
jgi:argininosuccinate lyase